MSIFHCSPDQDFHYLLVQLIKTGPRTETHFRKKRRLSTRVPRHKRDLSKPRKSESPEASHNHEAFYDLTQFSSVQADWLCRYPSHYHSQSSSPESSQALTPSYSQTGSTSHQPPYLAPHSW